MIVIGAFLALVVLVVYYNLLLRKSALLKLKNMKLAPEAAGAWPIIGHLHNLAGGIGGNGLLHEKLGVMADKHGPAFIIRMGLHKALVVSSWEVVKECFTTNDVAFISRPHQVASKHMGYGMAMFGFASPDGPYWRELRKILKQELLSNTRLELLKHVWASEINTSIEQLYEKVKEGSGSPVLVEMKRWFADLTLKMTVKVICGKRYFRAAGNSSMNSNEGEVDADDDDIVIGGRFEKALRDFFRLLGLFRVVDVLPFFRWLDFGGYKKEMENNGRVLDSLMEEWLQEHKRKRKNGSTEADFMNVMISKLLDDTKLLSYFDADTINKSTCLTLILGASDTTMITLTWALSLLVNHPQVLKRAQDELDVHVGRERQVDNSDIKNLTYLQAIIKETLRICPPGPLSPSHESKDDCTVAGYHVPAGTRLIVNTWKIQRDPRVWPNPSEFKPERFLTTHVGVDVRGHNFELIPFGSGRRSCPGTSFALQFLHLALARFIHGFEFKTPSDAPIDMTESGQIINVKATPLEVLVTPRIPSGLYA